MRRLTAVLCMESGPRGASLLTRRAARLRVPSGPMPQMTTWTHSYKNLARLLEKNGRAKEAMEFLDVVADRLANDALRFYSALLLPYVYQDRADIDGWRKTFKRNLRALAKRGEFVCQCQHSLTGLHHSLHAVLSPAAHAQWSTLVLVSEKLDVETSWRWW